MVEPVAKSELAPVKPMAVVVETYAPPVAAVNGQAILAALLNVVQSVDEIHPAFDPLATVQPMVKPEPMIDCPAVAVIPPDDEMVPVATVPSVDGVPLPVQYASCPTVGVEDVETLPLNSVEAVKPPRVPDQSPEVLSVSAPEELVSPVPSKLLND